MAAAISTSETVFIVGIGTVDRNSVNCVTCGDTGFVVTEWADDGDAENGPAPYATNGHWCDCETGIKAMAFDEEMADDYRQLEEASGMTPDDINAEHRHYERQRWMEVCGLEPEDVVETPPMSREQELRAYWANWESCRTCGNTGFAPNGDYCGCDIGTNRLADASFAANVEKVWICVASESASYPDEDGEYVDQDPLQDTRMDFILTHIYGQVMENFPNATDVSIINGGVENQYSWFFPSRIEDADGDSYPHAGEVIDEFFDKAMSACWERYPSLGEDTSFVVSVRPAPASADPDELGWAAFLVSDNLASAHDKAEKYIAQGYQAACIEAFSGVDDATDPEAEPVWSYRYTNEAGVAVGNVVK